MFFIAYKKFGGPLITGIARALNGLIFAEAEAISHAPEFHLPTGDVLHVVFFRNDGTAGFKDQRLEALFRQFLRCPASRNSGADNDGIVSRLLAHGCFGSLAGEMLHPWYCSGMTS